MESNESKKLKMDVGSNPTIFVLAKAHSTIILKSNYSAEELKFLFISNVPFALLENGYRVSSI